MTTQSPLVASEQIAARADLFTARAEAFRELFPTVFEYRSTRIHEFLEQGYFTTPMTRNGEAVELRDCAQQWLIETAISLEFDGLGVISDMFGIVVSQMGADADQPTALAETKLTTASSEIETVTRVGELLELVESVRPIFASCRIFMDV